MREFTTAVTEAAEKFDTDNDWPLEFMLDGRVMHFRRPVGGEGVLLITAMATHNDVMSKFASVLDIVSRVLRPDDRDWINGRLLNLDDPFSREAPKIYAGSGDEGGIVHEIVEQWGGHPTESPSPSSASPPMAGSPFQQPTPPPTSYSSPYPGY